MWLNVDLSEVNGRCIMPATLQWGVPDVIKVTGDPRILKLKKKKLFNFLVARK